MTWRKFYLLQIILLSCITSGISSLSAFAEEYHALQAQHLTLRNRDPEFRDSTRWQSLASRFRDYARQHSQSVFAPKAHFDSADIEQRLGNASLADELFAEVVERYPHSDMASAALYRRYQLSSVLERDAQSFTEHLFARYPRSRETFLLKYKREQSADDEEDRTQQNALHRGQIMIDPGHGGEDHGASRRGGLYEKDIALRLARLLAEKLRVAGYHVTLTRESDTFLPLSERVQIIQRQSPNLVLSLHVNSSKRNSARGIEIYTAGESKNAHARMLVKREDGASAGVRSGTLALAEIVDDLFADERVAVERALSQELFAQLSDIQDRIPGLIVRRPRTAGFYLLRHSNVPTVMLELLYLSNDDDAELLTNREVQTLLLRAVTFAVERHLEGSEP